MKWLIAFVLLFSIPTAGVAAQEVTASALASASSLSSTFPEPQPRPRPQTINDDDVRGTWELGLGYTFVRFRSSLFSASMNGLDSTVSYYLRDHIAVEGDVTAAFSEDARYLFYGGGVKVSKGNPRLQPFAHALVGGIHMFPQTAFSNNGFALRLGGGAETRLRQQLWLRVEGDYVRTQLYSSGQNNFQAVASINYRF
jgi:opacity protein-like surface antigen